MRRRNNTSTKKTFGLPLDADSTVIPTSLISWFDYIELKGLDEEGIFRVSGNAIFRQKYQQTLDSGGSINLSECDVHDVAALIKLYFRELPTPLFTYELYDCFIAAIVTKHDSSIQGVDIIRKVVGMLPPGHLCVLRKLMDFLRKVRSRSKYNKMSVENLATVFAPNLLKPPGGDMKVAVADYPFQISLLVTLIEDFDDIFETAEAERIRVAAKTKEKADKFKKMMEDKYSNGNMVSHLEGGSSVTSLSPEEIQQRMQAKYTKIKHMSDRFYQLQLESVSSEVFLRRLSERYEKIQLGEVLVEDIEKERNLTLRRWSAEKVK